MSTIETATQNAPAASIVESDRPCIKCGYNLKGLAVGGACSECGAPVADSLRGELLQYATPEYIRTIRQGVSLVLNAILLSIILGVCAAGAGVASALMGTGGRWIPQLIQAAMLVPAVMSFLGYLKFTAPDPGFTGIEKPDSARNVIRITVLVQIFIALVMAALSFGAGATPSAAGSAPGGSMPATAIGLFVTVVSILSYIAWAVQFFAAMRYVRWLGARIPDQNIIRRTKRYMWLLPVLATVGVLLLGLGPLIALILFWNLLDRLRKHLTAIRDHGVPAELRGMAG